MKLRPIPFVAPMVKATLVDLKTQTRRIVRPQPDWIAEVGRTELGPGPLFWPIGALGQQCGAPMASAKCPYGVAGDGLYVREALCLSGLYAADSAPIVFPGVDERRWLAGYLGRNPAPPMHCPRWASRIRLEVTDVRVQRLQEISDDDCEAEGVGVLTGNDVGPIAPLADEAWPRAIYRTLWDGLNAKRGFGWNANPWVWAITFKRIDEQ